MYTVYKPMKNKIIWKIMLYCSVNILLYKIFLYSITLTSCPSGLWLLSQDHQMHMPVMNKKGKEKKNVIINTKMKLNMTKTLISFRMISRCFIALVVPQMEVKPFLSHLSSTQPPAQAERKLWIHANTITMWAPSFALTPKSSYPQAITMSVMSTGQWHSTQGKEVQISK